MVHPRPLPLRAAALAAALALALALALASAAPAAAALPDQGVYEGCGPALLGDAACHERLDAIAAGGFRVVLNYTAWYGNAAQVRAYADRAAAAGVKLIWPLNARQWRDGGDLRRVYRFLSPDCGCTDNDGFTRFAIGLVKDHPATWGYYIADEVPADQVGLVDALGDRVRALDPAHPQLIVSLEDSATLGSNLRPFADSADVIGSDVYPVGTHHPLSSVGEVSREVQAMARPRAKRSAMVLQSFDWAQYGVEPIPGHEFRWPTVEEMREMRDGAIVEGSPDLILWYSYQDIVRSDDPDLRWRNLRAAAFAPEPRPPQPGEHPPAGASTPIPGPIAAGVEPPVLSAVRVRNAVSPRSARRRARAGLAGCRRVRGARAQAACRRRARAPRPTISWTLSAPATVDVELRRASGRRLGRVRVAAQAGRGLARVPARVLRRLRPGRHVARLVARSGEAASQPVAVRFRVR